MFEIATDGSSLGNPGPGAHAFIADLAGRRVERALPFANVTNGEMEVRGMLAALLFLADEVADPSPARVKCDSQYVVNGINEWLPGWKAKGFTKKGGLAHAELWRDIDTVLGRLAAAGREVRVEWIRAHQNTGSLNDQVDALAQRAARTQEPVGQLSPAVASSTAANPTAVAHPTPQSERPSYSQLAELLRDAKGIIDGLVRASDDDAIEFSRHLAQRLAAI